MDSGQRESDGNIQSELVDVSQMNMMELSGLENSALARAMRRIFDEVDRAQGSIAGWQSAI